VASTGAFLSNLEQIRSTNNSATDYSTDPSSKENILHTGITVKKALGAYNWQKAISFFEKFCYDDPHMYTLLFCCLVA
jgi:hypothetical protein